MNTKDDNSLMRDSDQSAKRIGSSRQDWVSQWVNITILHQNSPLCNPMGEDFNYAREFESLNLEAVKEVLDYSERIVPEL